MVNIGHASIDENKKISGGVAGDQTGKELCIRSWYCKPWDYLLRCKEPIKAELIAQACEKACNNPYIGYDQNERNTLHRQAIVSGYDLSKIKIPCECDCSSFVAVCAECAGIGIPYNGTNAPTTSTMKNAFLSTGFFEIYVNSKYTSTDMYLKRGDILIKEGNHVVIVLGDGQYAYDTSKPKNVYIIGETYVLQSNMYIRSSAEGSKVKYECITLNAKQNAISDDYGCAILKKGTKVTCKEVISLENSTWIRIPSGWICAENENKKYIL